MNERSQDSGGWCCDSVGQTPESTDNCDNRPCDPYFNISTVDSSNDVYTTPVYIDKDVLIFNERIYVIYGSDALWQVYTVLLLYGHHMQLV